MPAAPEGKWIVIYYDGRTEGFNYNSSSVETNFKARVEAGEKLILNIMPVNTHYTIKKFVVFPTDKNYKSKDIKSKTKFLCYIDEFLTIKKK